jgi:hypothetical protein
MADTMDGKLHCSESSTNTFVEDRLLTRCCQFDYDRDGARVYDNESGENEHDKMNEAERLFARVRPCDWIKQLKENFCAINMRDYDWKLAVEPFVKLQRLT